MGATLPFWPEDSPLARVARTFSLRLAFCPAPGSRAEQSTAVRACAAGLFADAGLASPTIGRLPQGQPLWPAGWVGSLTHSRTLGAAVIAPASAVQSVGIDLEDPARLKFPLWPHVLTPAELAQATPASAADSFSAKEAIYKTLAPLTAELPGFHDVELTWAADGTFTAHAASGRSVHPLVTQLSGLAGRHAGHVLALCWLPH